MKYITVTLNPAIDRMYTFDGSFKKGELNRTSQMSTVSYSGKGINVSRELFRLGIDSKVMCILSGEDGEGAYKSLIKEDLNLFAVKCAGRMRNNISLLDRDGSTTEINEPGYTVDFETVVKFLKMYDEALAFPDEKTVIISGSVPCGFRDDIYKMLILNARKNGAKTILDADGELLKKGMQGGPDLIKPNEKEFAGLLGIKGFSEKPDEARAEALKCADALFKKTGIEVLCTLGEKGSIYAGGEGLFEVPAVKTEIKRFKGAGDMYLARFIYERYEMKREITEAMRVAAEKTARNLSQ